MVEGTIPVEGTSEATQQGGGEQPSITELDSLERFKFDGREWTPQELKNAYLMQSDYTKKTEQLANVRKEHEFYENLTADLAKVKADPSLMAEFQRVYPKKFHSFLEYVTSREASSVSKDMGKPSQALDSDIMREFKEMKAMIYEDKVKSFEAQIDAKVNSLSKKYPFATEDAALSRAEALIRQGEKLTDQAWERIFSSIHERNKKAWESNQKEMVTKQKAAHAKGKDVPPGGGIPADAPRKFKNFKEATEAAIQELTARR